MFFLGLVVGAAVPAFANARMGLSVHLAGVQTGMALAILGLVWRHVSLSPGAERFAAIGNIAAAWMIFAALTLAAAFGTSRSTPIAGAGHQGAAWQEAVVTGLLLPGSALMLFAWATVLVGFRRQPAAS
jgi:hydroxylaminobenzene mutase